jgi:hypothetical protein
VGTFGHPDGGGPFPVVVAPGESDGGTPEYFLNVLVPEGFAVWRWSTGELRTQLTLADVPLERVERGLRWLREQPSVRTLDGRVGMIGASKGRGTRAPLCDDVSQTHRSGRRPHTEQRGVDASRLYVTRQSVVELDE